MTRITVLSMDEARKSHHLDRQPLVRKRPGFPMHFTDGAVLTWRERKSETGKKGWQTRRERAEGYRRLSSLLAAIERCVRVAAP